MYYDLNVPYIANQGELQRTLAFLAELGYNTVALDYSINDKLPASIVNEIPDPLPLNAPTSLKILRRCTLHFSDPSQNHRLKSLASAYDILALRPLNKKALEQCCYSLECDLISLDLSTRFPFYFNQTTLGKALQRGIRFEVCYSSGIFNSDGGASRRNLISNATQMVRATRGRGLVISSEARRALACRGPADVINMGVMWGLGQERGTEAVGREARSVVVQAGMKRSSFRGVIDVVYGGEKPERPTHEDKEGKNQPSEGKRKAAAMEGEAEESMVLPKPISKREQKRQAKKARLEHATAPVKDSSSVSKANFREVSVSKDDGRSIPVANVDAG
ncbi:ribonuclease P/MRP protein subunit RPP1, partial [Lecanoromycetidae sp. Uapishka_2]